MTLLLVKDWNPKTRGSQKLFKPRTQEDYEFSDNLDYIRETLTQTNKQGKK
jgi:phage anti-repressor protein